MKLYRYVAVSADTLPAVNRLLATGWQPVREVDLRQTSGEAQAGRDGDSGTVLVLCERESAFPQFSGEVFAGNVPVEFLADVPLLAGLTADELRQVIARCEVVEENAGEAVFREGDEDLALYVVLEGEVHIQLPELRMEQAEPIVLMPKDVFGELTFFAGGPHGASAYCTANTRLLRWRREVYDEFVQASHPLAFKVGMNAAAILAERLQVTDRWVWDLLNEEQGAQSAASWRRFRGRIMRRSEASTGFFGV